ncbi:sodium:solute symporter family protein [Lyticum sinuosum]|uniref:Sodium:alanine symporter family protein n=1 Tax=Lyticum sinuosum TaxID=1332059 RepID=A0AAE4VLI0_9RICK|nr:sodium:solute symporter family protein [Lyticum sinuosum]MDZ5761467.1 Sodium:alanine symporter family protein [Lyticum sinuosum]
MPLNQNNYYLSCSNLSIEDILIIVAYLIFCLLIGLSKISSIKTIRCYALGSKDDSIISTVFLVTTLFSTYIGARMTIGVIGRTYESGLVYGIAQIVRPAFWLVTGFVFAKNISKFKGCLSLSDIMEKMYGISGKWIINIFSLPLSCGILAAQVLAMGKMFEYFIGTSQIIGVLCGMIVLIIYSVFGGVRAVIVTDFAQFIILFIAFPISAYVIYYAAGGWEIILANLPDTHKSIDFSNKNNITELVSFISYCLLPCTAATYIQRMLISGNEQQIKKIMKINAILTLPLIIVLLIISLSIKSVAPNLERADIAMFYAIDKFLPVGVRGLVIAGILAVIMSSADSWLNTTGIMLAHDVVKKMKPSISDRTELIIAKYSSGLVGFIAITIALNAKSLLSLLWTIDNFWEPMIIVPLCAGFLDIKITTKEFLCGVIFSIIGVITSANILRGNYDIVTLVIGLLFNIIGVITMRYLFKFVKNDFFKKNY